MRICLDGQGLSGNLTGGGKVLAFLLRQLRRDFPEHEYLVLSPGRRAGWRLPRQLLWEQVEFPWRALRAGGAVLHAPGGSSGPILRHRRLVMTIHDIAPTRHPELLPHARSRWYWGRWIPFTARFADAVLVPSRSTQRDLIELVRIPKARIRVIPLGVPLELPAVPDPHAIERVRHAYGLPERYLLYVGTIDRRKDYRTLLEAVPQLDGDVGLVLAGTLIAGRTDFPQLIERLGLRERVRCLGYVPDGDLPGLYRGAVVFVYPSFYEGFGLPVLEAMACGAPVIAYRTTSLPEVVGEAGILLDAPWTAEVLAAAIRRLLRDEARRLELRQAGLERVKCFTWAAAARRTMEVYAALAGAAGG